MRRFLKTKWFRIFSGTIFLLPPAFGALLFRPCGGRSAYFTNLLKNFHSSSPVSMSCSPHACLPPTIS